MTEYELSERRAELVREIARIYFPGTEFMVFLADPIDVNRETKGFATYFSSVESDAAKRWLNEFLGQDGLNGSDIVI